MIVKAENRLPQTYDPAPLAKLFRDFETQVNLASNGRIQAASNATTAAPTTGTNQVGDFVRNSTPVKAGTVGSRYIILGYVCTVAGTPGTWEEVRALTEGIALRGYLSGCALSTAGGSATMSIAAGDVVDSTIASMMSVQAIAKTTGAWAVGTGNGGKLSGAAIANNTWYHFHAIKRVDTGVVDVGFDLSATTPTMPTNYTLFRRIGSGLTDGAAQWKAFIQDGDVFRWVARVQDIAAASVPNTAVTRTMSTPLGVRVEGIFSVSYLVGANAPAGILLSDLSLADEAPNVVGAIGDIEAHSGPTQIMSGGVRVFTNTSSQIRSRITLAGGVTDVLYISTTGWIDRRGRDA